MPKIDISEETKEKIKELKKLIKRKIGREVSTKEIIDKALEKAFESKKDFINLFREKDVPLSKEEIKEFEEVITDFGEENNEEEIDKILYDDPF